MTTKRELERRVKDAAMRCFDLLVREYLDFEQDYVECVKQNILLPKEGKKLVIACAALAAHERKRRKK